MKNLIIPVFAVITAWSPAVGADPSPGNHSPADLQAIETTQLLHTISDERDGVRVSYMLDRDGTPYLISIHSDDPAFNRLVLDRIDPEGCSPKQETGRTLAISIDYNHIR